MTSHMKEVPKCPKLVIKQTLLLCEEFEGVLRMCSMEATSNFGKRDICRNFLSDDVISPLPNEVGSDDHRHRRAGP